MPELGFVRGIITVLTLLSFLGICWWAYRPGSRARFEEDGLLAFDDHELEPSRASSVSEQDLGRRKEGDA